MEKAIGHALLTFTGHPLSWHIYGILLVAVLILFDRKSKNGGVVIIFFWNLLGVLLHEIMHLVVGVALFAKPVGFSLLPHRQDGGWQLGAVSFSRLNAINSLPVGLAPVSLVAIAYFLFLNWHFWFTASLFSTLCLYAILFILTYNAMPSWQDLRIAFNIKGIALYGSVAFLAYQIWWS